jgi:hypothetical protein
MVTSKIINHQFLTFSGPQIEQEGMCDIRITEVL